MIYRTLLCTAVLCLSLHIDFTQGCRAEVCRRRRATVVESDVLLHLQGCSGQTKPWVRQMAYCLDMSTAKMALEMKNWYARTYTTCKRNNKCISVSRGTSNPQQITLCTDCFLERLENAKFFSTYNDSFISQVRTCVQDYVLASLSTELPVFTAETQRRGRVKIPTLKPSNNWWALTVRLPCKPPLFRFWNANCINSFADDSKSRDFVLSQNTLRHGDIVFLATFSDSCRFDINSVEIIWSKSTPAFAAPQISSFPTSYPPQKSESGSIFFNEEANRRLKKIDGGKPPIQRRQRRQAIVDEPYNLGIALPCEVRDFKVFNNGGTITMKSSGTRYLIEPAANISRSAKLNVFNDVNFTLDFGFANTGCLFSSNEPEIVVNPPQGWLDEEKQETCYTCNNAASDAECKQITKCRPGQICMSEVRQISRHKVSITKSCKEADACYNNQKQNIYQCKPGSNSSVCRCCCKTKNNCNVNSYMCTSLKSSN